MKSKKEIVLLGGTGFIGTYLSRNLSKRKNINLSVIHKGALKSGISKINYYQVNGAREGRKMGRIISNADCVVILTQPDINLIKNLLTYGSGIKKIVHASTMLLYKESKEKQGENSPLAPLTPYEYEKVEEEKLLSQYANSGKTMLTISRLGNVYGDIQNRGIIQLIYNAILTDRRFKINGDGSQKRDYIFVEDAVKFLGYLIFSHQKKQIDIFNLCGGKAYTVNEIISLIENITNKKLRLQKEKTIKEKKVIIGNNNKILKFSDLALEFNLQKGLISTYKNYKKNIKSN